MFTERRQALLGAGDRRFRRQAFLVSGDRRCWLAMYIASQQRLSPRCTSPANNACRWLLAGDVHRKTPVASAQERLSPFRAKRRARSTPAIIVKLSRPASGSSSRWRSRTARMCWGRLPRCRATALFPNPDDRRAPQVQLCVRFGVSSPCHARSPRPRCARRPS